MTTQPPLPQELDQRLEPWRKLPWEKPVTGWLRQVRDALGMTTRQLAASMGVSQAAVVDAERAEAAGDISLKTLRRYATAMDCELVYVLLPRNPVQQTVEERAERLARTRLSMASDVGNASVQHGDVAAAPELEAQVAKLCRQILSGRRSELWKA